MLAFDSQATVAVFLAHDLARPEAERPTFLARHPTARTMLRVQALLDQAGGSADGGGQVAAVLEALGLLLVGGRNLPAEYALERLPDWLTVWELWELVTATIVATRLDEADRKKSAWPSLSAGADSAPAAATAGA